MDIPVRSELSKGSDTDKPDNISPLSSYSEDNSVHPIEFLEQVEDESPSLHMFSHQFVCIEYPGLVKDDEKVLKTLGGLDGISTAYSKKNRRVELRFRPDDLYCKPACGNKHQITGILLKVKVRRKRLNPSKDTAKSSSQNVEQGSGSGDTISSVSVLGQVKTSYRFTNLCDFQYIPTDGKTCIYDSLVSPSIPSASWLHEESDYFLPPPVFSRMDNMQPYFYQKDKRASSAPRNIIGCTRQKRIGHGVFINFENKEVPTKAKPQTLKLIEFKNLTGEPFRLLSQLFDERPVWSKNALIAKSGLSKDQLKYLLPCVAYYFITGPWRVMWVRFGYDPRTDRDARKYQTLDFRLRTAGGLKTKIKAKRSYTNYLLPYKSAPTRFKTSVISLDSSANMPATSQADPGETFIFRPGVLPPSRQMFYQYCDILVPEIEAMLEKLPTPAPNVKCHERHGWMPASLDVQCRDIINNLVLDQLKDDVKDDGETYNYALPGTMKYREEDEGDDYEDDDSTDEDDDENPDDDWEQIPDN